MVLSCQCPNDGDALWYFVEPADYVVAASDHSCRSCSAEIASGDLIIEFKRFSSDDEDLETFYFCERCADIFYNLSELGYCLLPDESMPDALSEYLEVF